MFPRAKRLSRGAFKGVPKGRRFHSPHFSYGIPLHEAGYAVVISKKSARLSVARHALKRRVLAALRALLPRLPAALVVFPKSEAAGLSYAEIREEIGGALRKISG